MKFFIPAIVTVVLISCNAKNSKKEDSKNGSTETATVEQSKVTKRWEPSAIDTSKPVDAVEANTQINCWDRRKAEVVGYGFVFYGDSLDTKNGIELVESEGGSKKLISCRFTQPPLQVKIAKTDMIHIKGRITGNFNNAITMDSCEIVAVGKSVRTQPVDPFSKPLMAAVAFAVDYFKWEGKEITIIGDYTMTTTSTTSYGVTIRVDLKNTATDKKVVGCNFKEDPTARIRVNEKSIIIKGKIKTYTPYGFLMLEDCSLVNR